MQNLIMDNVFQHQFGSENKKIPQERIEEHKENKRSQMIRPAESYVLNLETDLESLISDY